MLWSTGHKTTSSTPSPLRTRVKTSSPSRGHRYIAQTDSQHAPGISAEHATYYATLVHSLDAPKRSCLQLVAARSRRCEPLRHGYTYQQGHGNCGDLLGLRGVRRCPRRLIAANSMLLAGAFHQDSRFELPFPTLLLACLSLSVSWGY